MRFRDFSTEIVLIAVIMIGVGCLNVSINNRWKIPNTDLSVAVERTPPSKVGSPFKRQLIFEENYITKSKFFLTDEQGGYSRLNVYKISDKIYLLRDNWATYEINTEKKTLQKDTVNGAGEYVGAFDENESGNWRYIPVSERKEIPLGEIRQK